MFCYQCEQAARGVGCQEAGICGKSPEAAALQDLLLHACKGIAMHAHRARRLGRSDRAVDVFVSRALFTTVTNVNFDVERLAGWIREAAAVKDRARDLYLDGCRAADQSPETLGGPAAWTTSGRLEEMLLQAGAIGLDARRGAQDPTLVGLEELLTYGLKGAAAYNDHARVLDQFEDAHFAFFIEALDFLTGPHTADELLAMCLRAGEVNLSVMKLLDAANTGRYGHPEPTVVRTTPVAGKCILVSGHDLRDLEQLLEQTAGRGVNVYTHGEMLPACAYPGLKKHAHLVGNYGGAWQDQRREFAAFPGAILMTTNCIQEPHASYRDRLFTTGLVAWPGVAHVENDDLEPVIACALAAAGFARDEAPRTITTGFAHHTVLGVAGKVLDAVKSGGLRHVFVVGGCDGAKPGRNYFTDFVAQTPADSLVLTLGCGKYRFNDLELGELGGLPRLLDCGQCNDAYSAVVIATALAEALGCGVNDLPLSLVVSWYEQKAVAVLLSLLFLGIRGIRLGPTLPAFLTPPVLAILGEAFDLKATVDVAGDLADCLGAAA